MLAELLLLGTPCLPSGGLPLLAELLLLGTLCLACAGGGLPLIAELLRASGPASASWPLLLQLVSTSVCPLHEAVLLVHQLLSAGAAGAQQCSHTSVGMESRRKPVLPGPDIKKKLNFKNNCTHKNTFPAKPAGSQWHPRIGSRR